jgi:hypothetical protein
MPKNVARTVIDNYLRKILRSFTGEFTINNFLSEHTNMTDLRKLVKLIESIESNLGQEDIDLIKQAMEYQLAHPRKAVVSGEMAFVSNRLNSEYNRPDLGMLAWQWACNTHSGRVLDDYPELVALKDKLRDIDQESQKNFPDWGTSGT